MNRRRRIAFPAAPAEISVQLLFIPKCCRWDEPSVPNKPCEGEGSDGI